MRVHSAHCTRPGLHRIKRVGSDVYNTVCRPRQQRRKTPQSTHKCATTRLKPIDRNLSLWYEGAFTSPLPLFSSWFARRPTFHMPHRCRSRFYAPSAVTAAAGIAWGLASAALVAACALAVVSGHSRVVAAVSEPPSPIAVAAKAAGPQFLRDVAPILDKQGCSTANCHGKFGGAAAFNCRF
jgi:hypothetical protein